MDISNAERIELLGDLDDLAACRQSAEPEGIVGVAVHCDECESPHYLTWDLLRQQIEFLLDEGTMPASEPAHDPDRPSYMTWDDFLDFTRARRPERDKVERLAAELWHSPDSGHGP